mmetsp:Transcript_51327/g.166420  ORF Transcript_51327/g.166420 Transcript_51327/m.166420 type:complete len:264 (+) Transcript_51327:101-892(+)
MGAYCCGGPAGDPTVTLHIYDVGGTRLVRGANKIFRTLGTGAFHAGVEIYGTEWSFGFIEFGSGVFPNPPTHCPGHQYRERLELGQTNLNEHQVEAVIDRLAEEWQGPDYDLLRHNCCHFSAALCRALDVDEVPRWVTNLAGAGATINKGFKLPAIVAGQAIDRAANLRIIQAAKNGDVDNQYRVKGAMKARAQDLLQKAGELDSRLGISRGAQQVAGAAVAGAQQVGGAVVRSASMARVRLSSRDRAGALFMDDVSPTRSRY